ncbi:MAG: flagellar M-ring protein FliF [Gemmatimonadetes bacterium]|jgi:flagellar M-ring protein FliF|nr:flagellar M-ring protein FliF [Gemmatimonadota bacterium]MBT5058645.1 flagellar M-ring protein FliF [Gemmatimonadota bacterium]MBT5144082.1 flagellar M-ring protein FliF [Gemmatimonadota bacterium]MBT5590313.1 flagellar M-ring protein FliF [Gemmatimonadota bacterium]MBT5964390.1 flagellar M-ring protein FliF [Gemmatimonadota bacterium]
MNLPDQISGATDRPREWWSEAPQPQKFGAIGGAAVLVIAVVYGLMSLTGGDEDWDAQILYADLDYSEAAEISTRLNAVGMPFKLTDDASTIVVPDDKVREMRLMLAAEGFPRSGRMGYEIFDDTQLAMTDFLQDINKVRALQGELEETLSGIDGVNTARVHLVIPEESLFTEEQNPVTAAVNLTLGGRTALKPQQVDAIVNLVAASVEGLHNSQIVIVDQEGTMLTEEHDPLAQAANKQFRMQQKVEHVLEKKVQSLMDEVIGSGRSKVRINVVLDFSQRHTDEVLFDPPSGSQIVISEETNERQSAEQGSEENAVRNYEVNRTVRNIIGSIGEISRLNMALTVDQTKVIIGEDGRAIEQTRSADEIDNLAALAQQAIGYDELRGDAVTVFAMPFDKSQEIQARDEAIADDRKQFWTGIAINVAKVLGILAALITLRFIIQAIGRGVGVEEDIEVLGEVAGDVEEEDFERPETPHDIILSRVQQMVRERPEDAAKLIRTMLVEEGS